MDSETNGSQEATRGARDTPQQQGQSQVGGNETDYEKQIAEHDEKIASLEAQIAETVEHLCGVIDEKRARTLEDGELLVVSHQPTFRSSCIPLQIHSWPVLLHGTRA